MTNSKLLIVWPLISFLTGCGGSGGSTPAGGTPSYTPPAEDPSINSAPTISGPTSYESILCTEGSLQLRISDEDNDNLSISLSGPDADFFRVESKQILSVMPLACDESGFDANSDLVYEISVAVSDGTLSTSSDIDIELFYDDSLFGDMDEAFEASSIVVTTSLWNSDFPDNQFSAWGEDNGQPVLFLGASRDDLVKVSVDSGQFQDAEPLFYLPIYTNHILVNDFDADGDDDLVRISRGAPIGSTSSIMSGAYVHENIDGSYAGGVQVADGGLWYASNAQLHDLDSDGDNDILVGQLSTNPSDLAYIENLGDLKFAASRRTGADITGGFYEIANFDLDNELEMFATNTATTSPAFYSVDGFDIQEIASYGNLSGNKWIWRLADINLDGVPEVIGLERGVRALNGLILGFDGVNISSSQLVETGASARGDDFYDFVMWDVDGDNDKDMVLFSLRSGFLFADVSELQDGYFQTPKPFFNWPFGGSFIDLKDLDGDSNDELIIGGPTSLVAFRTIKRGNFQAKP